MSWSLASFGKTQAVRMAVQQQIQRPSGCNAAEEQTRQMAGQLLETTLASQDPMSVVQVQASGYQSTTTVPGAPPSVTNTLNITLTTMQGFIE